MTKEEILSHLNVGGGKCVCVDCSINENYPGIVRTITIAEKAELRIEFDTHNHIENEFPFTIQYPDLDTLIKELEKYLNLKLELWENFTKSGNYPELEEKVDFQNSWKKLKQDYFNGKPLLPSGGIE